MASFTDQTGKTISLTRNPIRIISLVPSQTELLFQLGLEQEVIGITKFCVHPPSWFRSKLRIGGTKQLNIPLIHTLKPDLIIANKEENAKEQVEELARHYPVWTSDIQTIDEAYSMINSVGVLVNRQTIAASLIAKIKYNFNAFLPASSMGVPTTACYLIWKNPYMSVGSDTFIHAMMEAAGYENIMGGKQRYPEISIEELKDRNPALLLLSSEPFPFKQTHLQELQMQLPNTLVRLVDGEMFSWYGSRMLYAAEYLAGLR